ncbi:MAG: hypothetical protein KF762_19120 [Acidobacteria bacterium]|nr:hypothetical protein [Acidobacteriota bacterium]
MRWAPGERTLTLPSLGCFSYPTCSVISAPSVRYIILFVGSANNLPSPITSSGEP